MRHDKGMTGSNSPLILTEENFHQSLKHLGERDSDLARVLTDHGPPPLWAREPGFPTLVLIILEQQVSLASARAAYERLCAVCEPLTPELFLRLDKDTLRLLGFSRQKAEYCRGLARAVQAGILQIEALEMMDDTAVREELMGIKGIGPWTADIYLLMALRRPDIWPSHDLALAVAVHELKDMKIRPTPDELELVSCSWRPWRAVAARLLWHYYLSTRG